METKILRRLAMLGCVVYAYALNAQTNEVATPLFSLDVKDVVSMYSDENAETFYLHTRITGSEGIKYTVSRKGEILAEEPSQVMWACWEDGVMYTHGDGDDFFLSQDGDTVVKMSGFTNLKTAKPMSRKDGIFYYWKGPWSGVSNTCWICSIKEGGDEIVQIIKWSLYCTGLASMDNYVVCIGYNSERTGFYTIYFNDESSAWGYQTPKELPGVKYPVGLSLVGDTFYVWSNDTQTMYTIPKSYFGGVTGVQAPVVDTDMESIYGIDGRPADGTQKGICILGGKKVLVR